MSTDLLTAQLHPVLRGTRHRRLGIDGVVGAWFDPETEVPVLDLLPYRDRPFAGFDRDWSRLTWRSPRLTVNSRWARLGREECSMDPVQGARTFQTTGEAYDAFMGRYSYPLAVLFADAADVTEGLMTLDIGCGPGALTGVLVDVLGSGSVVALDPSPAFVSECATRHPGVAIRPGRAEAIPFDDGTFDRVLAQLVLHFVSDPAQAAQEFRRVLRPAGLVSACAWDSLQGMEMLTCFWDAALTLDPQAPAEAQVLRFGRPGEIAQLLDAAGFKDPHETTLSVTSSYADFDELWSGFLAGIGPAGAYCLHLPVDARADLRSGMFDRLGSPSGPLSLAATARSVSARAPG